MRVQPHGSWKNGFGLIDDRGQVVGSFSGSVWREGGRIQAGGREWECRREGGRRFELPGLAVAQQPSMWSTRWSLWIGDRTYELAEPGWLTRRYELRLGGRPVGQLSPRGFSERRADVDLPADLPPAAQVFVVVVVLTQWRRESTAAAAAN